MNVDKEYIGGQNIVIRSQKESWCVIFHRTADYDTTVQRLILLIVEGQLFLGQTIDGENIFLKDGCRVENNELVIIIAWDDIITYRTNDCSIFVW